MKIGDKVYIIGKYSVDPSEQAQIMYVEIAYTHQRQFVAYRLDGEPGEFRFSNKHIGKCVFLTEEEAIIEWRKQYESK